MINTELYQDTLSTFVEVQGISLSKNVRENVILLQQKGWKLENSSYLYTGRYILEYSRIRPITLILEYNGLKQTMAILLRFPEKYWKKGMFNELFMLGFESGSNPSKPNLNENHTSEGFQIFSRRTEHSTEYFYSIYDKDNYHRSSIDYSTIRINKVLRKFNVTILEYTNNSH